MSGDHDKYFTQAVECDGVYLTPEEMNEIKDALYEAAYLLNPTDDDMQKEAGMYRIVTALEKLKDVKPKRSHEEFLQDLDDWAKPDKREWVGLTEVEIRYALREWAETDQTVREMLYAIEDKLREKNT